MLALPLDSREIGYRGFYEALSELRELFHSTGRFDDSNAKLDEITKLFATYLAYKSKQIAHFPLESADDVALIESLQAAFAEVAMLPSYRNETGASIFGSAPSLSLRALDGLIARKIVSLVRYSIDTALANSGLARPFDIINEAFGHFVRDNFRGNIEDAQYMTPPEVVDFMVQIALDDLDRRQLSSSKEDGDLLVVDPSCGVGSFLTSFNQQYALRGLKRPLRLFGQDKVERMVRLSKINLELFGNQQGAITIGNSLFAGSPLDRLNGKVDLILTNPPFGARFDAADIALCSGNLSIFSTPRLSARTIDSELLFIDRDLSLLREGGRLLIVVPDSAVSSSGPASIVRQYIRKNATLQAIIELPPVTFAQAGTRTRTVVLYVEKTNPKKSAKPVLFAKAEQLGFDVKSRKGVQIKVSSGNNDLTSIRAAYSALRARHQPDDAVLSKAPSAVAIAYSEVLGGSWTPNHYHADRIITLERLHASKDVTPTRLDELVEFVADSRKTQRYSEGSTFIGVLHILTEGVLDVAGIRSYKPKTPGVPTHAGELLLSKINPRIPRVIVVPDLGLRVLCSAEFEVMRARKAVDPYFIAFLLNTEYAQRQIRSLTSGTSASHNRIKTRDLAQVLLPVPLKSSKSGRKVRESVRRYRDAITTITRAYSDLADVERMRSAEIA